MKGMMRCLVTVTGGSAAVTAVIVLWGVVAIIVEAIAPGTVAAVMDMVAGDPG